jgi:hypothetical protein
MGVCTWRWSTQRRDTVGGGGSRLSKQQEVEGELKVRGRPGFELLYYENRSQNDMDDDDDDHRSCSENTPVLIAMADGGWRRVLSLLSFFCFGCRSDTQDKV